ncbi:pentapeptide repeat-containing protein [Nostoc sp.]
MKNCWKSILLGRDFSEADLSDSDLTGVNLCGIKIAAIAAILVILKNI